MIFSLLSLPVRHKGMPPSRREARSPRRLVTRVALFLFPPLPPTLPPPRWNFHIQIVLDTERIFQANTKGRGASYLSASKRLRKINRVTSRNRTCYSPPEGKRALRSLVLCENSRYFSNMNLSCRRSALSPFSRCTYARCQNTHPCK